MKKKLLSQDAVAKLRRVKLQILAEPELYAQSEPYIPKQLRARLMLPGRTQCGSAGCIFGFLAAGAPRSRLGVTGLRRLGAEILGIDLDTGRGDQVAHQLYCSWPVYLRDRYQAAVASDDRITCAVLGACAIELFILTDGFQEIPISEFKSQSGFTASHGLLTLP